ncbi:MAG: hypothetical protein ABIM19_09190 [candidate division WOR-3 bacterium]
MIMLILFSALGYPVDLKIELVEPRDTFYTDVEDVTLRVEAINISPNPVPMECPFDNPGEHYLQNTNLFRFLDLEIVDEKGNLVEYEESGHFDLYGKLNPRPPVDTLAPGESVFFYITFSAGGYLLWKHPGWCTIQKARFNLPDSTYYEDTLTIRLYSKRCYTSCSEEFNEALKMCHMLAGLFPGATHEEKLEKQRKARELFVQTYPDHPAVKGVLRGLGPKYTDPELLKPAVLNFPEYCLARGILDGYKKQDEAFYWEIIGEMRKMKDRPMLQQLLKDKGLLTEDQK